MNIIKLQNMLRGVPDDALINYVQNPQGEVPSYLALSELQRRKDTRAKYQAEQAPESSVAEDLGQPSAPQVQPQQAMLEPQAQGVAGLPVPDQMFSGQGMAAGGIVAFDDGGEVATSKLGDFFRGLGNLNAVNIDKQIGALQAEKNKIKSDIFRAYTPSERASQQKRLADIDSQISTLTSQRSGKAPNTPTSVPGANVLGSEASAATPSQNPLTGLVNPNAPVNVAPSNVPPAANIKPSIAGLAADGTNPYALEKVKGIGDYAKELKDYIGADPMRAQLQERLSKMDEAAAKQAEQAPWMALAQAGFGIAAGKSPFALQNIAEGAGAGLKEYAAAKDKMAALEDKRFALLNDMAQADRKEQIAIGTYGANSKQAVEERNAKAKLQQQHDKVLERMNTQDNQVKLAGSTVKGALEAKDILKYKTDFRANHPDYLAWQKDMINRKGKSVVNTPEYKKASEILLDQLVARDATLSAPSSGSAKFLGFE
jgi:hypothetical protein